MKTVLNIDTTDNILSQPLFLGEDMALQRYDTIKYPIFMELYDAQINNFWRPQEINLAVDRVDYRNLTDNERFVFESNLRWQTMTDSMLSRSINKMSDFVTNPELEICMCTWSFFETIHSNAYTYILQNTLDNPKEFFDSILKDTEIVRRAKETSDAYDKLLGDPTDIKEKLFNAVISTQIAEGLAFYTSFACSFFFGYKGKMEGNSKIISLIARDERLHVDITKHLLKIWKTTESEGFKDVFAANTDKIYEMFKVAVESEFRWVDYLFSKGPLLGLNGEILKQYIMWLANQRLKGIGLNHLYPVKVNPIAGWVEPLFNSGAKQNAPQETEIESYQIGARNTNIDNDAFKDFAL